MIGYYRKLSNVDEIKDTKSSIFQMNLSRVSKQITEGATSLNLQNLIFKPEENFRLLNQAHEEIIKMRPKEE